MGSIGLLLLALLNPIFVAAARNDPQQQAIIDLQNRLIEAEKQMQDLRNQVEELIYTVNQLRHKRGPLPTDLPPAPLPFEGTAGESPLSHAQQEGPIYADPALQAPSLAAPYEPMPLPAPSPYMAGVEPTIEETPQAWLEIAQHHIFSQNDQQAEGYLHKILHFAPDSAQSVLAYYWLGEFAFQKKDYGQASHLLAQGYARYRQLPPALQATPGTYHIHKMLYKLILSFEHLHQLKQARATLLYFLKTYPIIPTNLQKSFESLKKRLLKSELAENSPAALPVKAKKKIEK